MNTLTETVRKPSLATRLRDLVAGDGGFTLLETLAVMVIIGLLAAITVPQIAKWREKAYVTALKTDARNIANAIEAFYVDKQRYPTTPAEFDALVASDVKLNPSTTGQGSYSTTMDIFVFQLATTQTSPSTLLTYRSNTSPTILIE